MAFAATRHPTSQAYPSQSSLVRLAAVAVLALPLAAFGGLHTGASAPLYTRPAQVNKAAALHAISQLPLSFEQSQTVAGGYLSRGAGYAAYLSPAGATMLLGNPAGALPARDKALLARGHANLASASAPETLRMALVGGNAAAVAQSLERRSGVINELNGMQRAGARTGIATYGQVRYANVYPGIDLRYYGAGSHLEYDFLLAPKADPSRIALRFDGAQRVSIDSHSNLVLSLRHGILTEAAPVLYQQGPHGRVAVAGHFAVRGNTVRFVVGAYDHRLPLVIDPIVNWSTYLGGSDIDLAMSVALDSAGNIYVTGVTASSDFPLSVSNPTGTPPTFPAPGTTLNGIADAFITKLSPDGATLIYSTYFAPPGAITAGVGIGVNAANQIYVALFTTTTSTITGLATTPFQATTTASISPLLFVVSADGQTPLYATYLSGTSPLSFPLGLAVDPTTNNAYLTGLTTGAGFPTTPTAFQQTNPEINAPIAVTGFVSVVNPFASGPASLVYSTYLGGVAPAGTRNIDIDSGVSIAIDTAGHAYATGFTSSAAFPTKNAFQSAPRTLNGHHGAVSAFVTELDITASGNASLVYSTYLGGSGVSSGGILGGIGDVGLDIAVDPAGAAYVTGLTSSSDFPITAGSVQTTNKGAAIAAFVTKLNPGGSGLGYSTYLSGSLTDIGLGIAVDATGAAYVTGVALSTDFPTTPGAPQPTLVPGFGFNLGGLLGVPMGLGTNLPPTITSALHLPDQVNNALQVTAQARTATANLAHTAAAAPRTPNAPAPAASQLVGADAFVTKLFPSGRRLIFSTFLGGNGIDAGIDIAVDGAGDVVVDGLTASTNFPNTDPLGSVDPGLDRGATPGSGSGLDGFVTSYIPSGCVLNGLFTSGANKIAVANIFGTLPPATAGAAPAISYASVQAGITNFVVRRPMVTCNLGTGVGATAASGTATMVGIAASPVHGLVHAGDTVVVTVSNLAGTAPTASVTVTRTGTGTVLSLGPLPLTTAPNTAIGLTGAAFYTI